MPIQPKVLELMRRVESGGFLLRFWIAADTIGERARVEDKLSRLQSALDQCQWYESSEVLEHVNHFFTPEDKIAAVEILNAQTLAGFVAYYEWP